MTKSISMPRRAMMLGAVAVVAVAPRAQAQQLSIAGVYNVAGRNPDGSTYSGRAVVGQQGNAVQINWTVGNQSYAGSGILNGQVLMINWGQSTPVVYVVMPDGTLHGTWNDGTALDRLSPL